MEKETKSESEIILWLAIIISVGGVLLGTANFFAQVSLPREGNNPFSGIGFFSIIAGVILIIIYIAADTKEIEKKDKKVKEKFAATTTKLLKRVKKFKTENGFSIETAIEINNEYYWNHDDYFLSIRKDAWYRYNSEKASGEYIDDLEEGKSVDKLDLFEKKIKISDIDYYLIKGELRTEQIVSGGGSSLTGAVVGGIVAGGVGAIIGSRKKIKTKSVTKDEREIILVYRNEKKLIKEKYNYYGYIEVFESLIPEKDHTYVTSKV